MNLLDMMMDKNETSICVVWAYDARLDSIKEHRISLYRRSREERFISEPRYDLRYRTEAPQLSAEEYKKQDVFIIRFKDRKDLCLLINKGDICYRTNHENKKLNERSAHLKLFNVLAFNFFDDALNAAQRVRDVVKDPAATWI